MRHQKRIAKLGKPQDQRKALLRALATSLFTHGRIKTTVTRAKALRPYAEKLITFAKKGDLHARRLASAYIYDNPAGESTVLKKLFAEIGPKYQETNGGYTRIYKIGFRRGDNAEMALIELT